jgi:hypothetical protein
MSNIVDLKQWLESRGVPFEWAKGVAEEVKERYPGLATALKEHKDVLGELEAILLVYEVMAKHFPQKCQNPTNLPE